MKYQDLRKTEQLTEKRKAGNVQGCDQRKNV